MRRTRLWLAGILVTLGLVLTTLLLGQRVIPTDYVLASIARKHFSSLQPITDRPTIVVAARSNESTDWLDYLPNFAKRVYVTDNETAVPTVPKNKGREGMVYLTYIIDNYDRLPQVIIFSHAQRYQWHNDDPLYDGLAVLSRLNISYVKTQGYTSLRCSWTIGCPREILPLADVKDHSAPSGPDWKKAGARDSYRTGFVLLFPNTTIPEVVATPCCAQFAVTAQKIQERPKADYERFRDWLLETPLQDSLSGRVMEYSWHIIFGQEAVHCPDAKTCYCKLYGLCGLKCNKSGVCPAVYQLAPYSTMPEDWPDYDWNGDWQNATEIRQKFEDEVEKAARSLNS